MFQQYGSHGMPEPKRYFINKLTDFTGQILLDCNCQKQNTLNIVSQVLQHFKMEPKNLDGGLYTGLIGASYMFYHLSKLPYFVDSKSQFLDLARQYLELPSKDVGRIMATGHITDKTGFLTGAVGVYAVGAVILHKLGEVTNSAQYIMCFKEVATFILPLDWFTNGGDELFVGRAGYLCGLLWMRREIGQEIISDDIAFKLLDTIIESGVSFSKRTKSALPLMYQYYGTLYLGPAHGLSGILFILLSFPKWLDARPESLVLIRQTLDGLLSLQCPNGNFPCAMDEVDDKRPEKDELVHWCHGAPGTVYVFAKAYKLFKQDSYLNAALRCGDITWEKGLLKKGSGICHGLAGNGYVFLVLHRLTGQKVHLHRAIAFMNFYYNPEFKMARTPDCPYSLYEGIAGLACFAGDVLHPEMAEFPFFSID